MDDCGLEQALKFYQITCNTILPTWLEYFKLSLKNYALDSLDYRDYSDLCLKLQLHFFCEVSHQHLVLASA